MYCGRCGTEVSNNVCFCPSCGNKLFSEEKEIVSEIKFDNNTVPKSKKKKMKFIIILIIVLFLAVLMGLVIYHFNSSNYNNTFDNKSNNYYLSKSISYGLVDYEDVSKGLKTICTTYYNEDGLVISEKREESITNYSYDSDNRITSIEVKTIDDVKSYLFNFIYEERDGITIGTSNSVSEYVSYELGDLNMDYGDNSMHWEYQYDNQNRVIYKANYYNDKELTYVKTEYYNNGKPKSSESFQGYPGLDNEINGNVTKTEYDEIGNVLSSSSYDSSGKLFYKVETEYKNNKPYKSTTYDSNGISSILVLNEENDSRYEFIEYNSDNEITGYTVTTCDSNGNIVKTEYFDDSFNPLNSYIAYQYDENNNQILSEQYSGGLINSKTEKIYTLKTKD